jgi:hypothetical protein
MMTVAIWYQAYFPTFQQGPRTGYHMDVLRLQLTASHLCGPAVHLQLLPPIGDWGL